jgi:hypothetical protein
VEAENELVKLDLMIRHTAWCVISLYKAGQPAKTNRGIHIVDGTNAHPSGSLKGVSAKYSQPRFLETLMYGKKSYEISSLSI